MKSLDAKTQLTNINTQIMKLDAKRHSSKRALVHITLCIITLGSWIPFYLIILAMDKGKMDYLLQQQILYTNIINSNMEGK